MKRLLVIFASILCALCLAFGFAACDNASGNQKINYTVKVQSLIGAPLRGVTVDVYDGEVKIATETTNENGEVTFKFKPDSYDVFVSNLPAGYVKPSDASYRTDSKGTPVTVTLNIEIIQEAAPSDLVYQKGDVMYDFTITDTDKKTHTLSTLLETKKAILINFFYDGCGPCATEFPWLNTAYSQFSESVEFLAISTKDNTTQVKKYKSDNNLTFPMFAKNAGSLCDYFYVGDGKKGVPTTIIIDRFGVVAFMETGRFENVNEIISYLTTYTSDDYVPETDYENGGDVGGEDGGEEDTRVLPDTTMPTSAEIAAAASGDGFTVEYKAADAAISGDFAYSWPWVVSEDGESIQPSNSNRGLHNSFATIYFKVSLKAGQMLAFDYKASCEYECDILNVKVDDTVVHRLSGPASKTDSSGNVNFLEEAAWKTCYAFMPNPETASATTAKEYTVILLYNKDYSNDVKEDTVYVNNIRIVNYQDGDELKNFDQTTTGVDILRHAANTPVGGTALPRYQTYIQPVYNETDGYYHVNSENGALLLADIQYGTYWNSSVSIYQLGYTGYCVFEGYDYGDLIDDYAWLAVNSDVGYTPVTEELRYLLELITVHSEFGKGGYDKNGNTDGSGENIEWLEMCVYYDHYGTTPVMENPIKGISFQSAIPISMNGQDAMTFTVVVDKAPLIPRGIRYQFIPEKSGVYSIRSLCEKVDTIGWIHDANGEVFAENDEDVNIVDGNFYFTEYLEKDTTYYLVCAYNDLYATGEFNVGVNYLGARYDHFTNCAVGPYTFSEITGQIYVPNAIDVQLDNGYYRAVRADGSLGSYIYLDVFKPTPFLPSQSIYDIALDALGHAGEGFDFSQDKRPNGTPYPNYTRDIIDYINQAYETEGELHGYVKVDEKLMTILKTFTIKYGFAEAEETAWQLLCFYYRHLGEIPAGHECAQSGAIAN